ncbi:hypothetical protein ILUMI_11780 [Ignelater luminosus]|uniref:Integrase catalytic domain-containing protein n=1 Tax=Ignelater luminosus TaxID=2038154 RepID=A0A8K0CXS7_IGNLU|nr:hypothetical protein ILUMI_11780 [Ignelater luminosus]
MHWSLNREPWDIVSTDLVTCRALRKATAATVTQAFYEEVITSFGTPQVVITDNGTQYDSRVFTKLLRDFGIEHQFTPPYTPQTNPVKRVNRTLKTIIAQFCGQNHRRWDSLLSDLAMTLNSSIQESTGFSPAFLKFGQGILLPKAFHREHEPSPGIQQAGPLLQSPTPRLEAKNTREAGSKIFRPVLSPPNSLSRGLFRKDPSGETVTPVHVRDFKPYYHFSHAEPRTDTPPAERADHSSPAGRSTSTHGDGAANLSRARQPLRRSETTTDAPTRVPTRPAPPSRAQAPQEPTPRPSMIVLSEATPYTDTFDQLQLQIENTSEDSESESEHITEFEENYYETISNAENILEKLSSHDNLPAKPSSAVSCHEVLVPGPVAAYLLETIDQRNQKSREEHFTAKVFVSTAIFCRLSKGSHSLNSCERFKQFGLKKRSEKAKELKICYNCTCRVTSQVNANQGSTVREAKQTIVNFSAFGSNQTTVLRSTALVRILDSDGNSHPARALLDSGSMSNSSQNNCATGFIERDVYSSSRPLCPLSTDRDYVDPFTPAHFLIGRSLVSVPDPDVSTVSKNRLTQFQRTRSKSLVNRGSFHEGDLVLLKTDNQPPLVWKLEQVIALHLGVKWRQSKPPVASSSIARPLNEVGSRTASLLSVPCSQDNASKAGRKRQNYTSFNTINRMYIVRLTTLPRNKEKPSTSQQPRRYNLRTLIAILPSDRIPSDVYKNWPKPLQKMSIRGDEYIYLTELGLVRREELTKTSVCRKLRSRLLELYDSTNTDDSDGAQKRNIEMIGLTSHTSTDTEDAQTISDDPKPLAGMVTIRADTVPLRSVMVSSWRNANKQKTPIPYSPMYTLIANRISDPAASGALGTLARGPTIRGATSAISLAKSISVSNSSVMEVTPMVRAAFMGLSLVGDNYTTNNLLWRYIRGCSPSNNRLFRISTDNNHYPRGKIIAMPLDLYTSFMIDKIGSPVAGDTTYTYTNADVLWTAIPVRSELVGQRGFIPYVASFLSSSYWDGKVNHLRAGEYHDLNGDKDCYGNFITMPTIKSTYIPGPIHALVVLVDDTVSATQNNLITSGNFIIPVYRGQSISNNNVGNLRDIWMNWWSNANVTNIPRDCNYAFNEICLQLAVENAFSIALSVVAELYASNRPRFKLDANDN